MSWSWSSSPRSREGGAANQESAMHANHYGRLAIMAALSFVAMYALMYAMVDRFANVRPNLNQLYMAGDHHRQRDRDDRVLRSHSPAGGDR